MPKSEKVIAYKGASKGSWIVLTERNYSGKILDIQTAQAGVTEGVKTDVWYRLKNSKFVEAV